MVDYLLQSHKQAPGRQDPYEVKVAEGHEANNPAQEGDEEEKLERTEALGFVGDNYQKMEEQKRNHYNDSANLEGKYIVFFENYSPQ